MYYVCNETGLDTNEGTMEAPFKTISKAIQKEGTESTISVFDQESKAYKQISKNQYKKSFKSEKINEHKKKSALEAVVVEKTEIVKEECVVVEEDSSLPATVVIKIDAAKTYENTETRVEVSGWVQSHTFKGKSLLFMVLRDGFGYLQCVARGDLCKTYDALSLTTESSVCVKGTIKTVPVTATAPGGIEMAIDYWHVVGLAPSGGESFESRIPADAGPSILLDNRHLVHRSYIGAKLLKIRNQLLIGFRRFYEINRYTEVNPPCFVQTQIEGGSTLFSLDYFGEPAYLTQSSQLYLESVCPVVGDVFCIQSSFRSEKSRTRRHLSEYTHIEAECSFLTYEDLMQRLEDMVCFVVDHILDSPARDDILELNPSLKKLERPFMRMDYKDAITWLNEHGVKKEEDDTDFVFGDDIPEKPERFMTDTIDKPIFLCRFPHEIKSFYMSRDKNDDAVTESFDLLMPGVGEITGGSMRISDPEMLLKAFKAHNISPEPYYWFVDIRKYGTFPHGGYGLGLDRFMAWIANRYHVRDTCLYPRYIGRCMP